MVDKEMLADLRSRVDFDPGEVTGDLREYAGKRTVAVVPEPVLGDMVPFGMETGVGQEDDERALSGGVLLLDRLDVLANRGYEAQRYPLWRDVHAMRLSIAIY